jgi:hypothetical protein
VGLLTGGVVYHLYTGGLSAFVKFAGVTWKRKDVLKLVVQVSVSLLVL